MESEDGELFIKSLAYYVRKHEKALANSLQSQRRYKKPTSTTTDTTQSGKSDASASSYTSTQTASNLAAALTLPFRTSATINSQNNNMTKLALTPNQLYYLLCRFQELNVSVGPMNVRLENMHLEPSSSNYVSFLTQVNRPLGRSADQDSLHSVSSVRSVMSSMANMWSNLGFSSEAKLEKRRAALMEDIRYLYSAFTKIPCVKLAVDHRARRIADYEEFPFDTAVPVHVFKNLTALEVKDTDFRAFFGWDILAEQLRYLTVKRAGLDDPIDLLTNIVLDDMDKRRRRSSKNHGSPTIPNPIPSPLNRYSELMRTMSTPVTSSLRDGKRMSPSDGLSSSGDRILDGSDPLKQPSSNNTRSISPSRQRNPRRGSTHLPSKQQGKNRRSSSTSTSSVPSSAHRNSSSNLLALGQLPSTKWRFLSHLSLADNGLTSISVQSLAPIANTLQSLDLSSNLFTEIPESLTSLVSLRALNLSNCMIDSLRSLSKHPLPAITVLNLRANRLTSLAGIEKLLSLERFDLRENRLRDPTEIARLTAIPEFREIYVLKNPFVKTHVHYRTTIFNLFRVSPGYTDDVSIDSTVPSYNERRQLADRANAPPTVPVVKPPVEEDVDSAVANDLTAAHKQSLELEAQPAPETMEATTPNQSQRKRKGPKRRVVSISQSSDVASPKSDRSAAQTPFMTAQQSLQDYSQPKLSRNKESSSPTPQLPEHDDARNLSSTEQTASEPETPTGVDERFEHSRPDLAMSSEMYRKRIEALKHDYGESWLTALGDENWSDYHQHVDPTGIRYGTPSLATKAPAGTVATAVTGGRTLGRSQTST